MTLRWTRKVPGCLRRLCFQIIVGGGDPLNNYLGSVKIMRTQVTILMSKNVDLGLIIITCSCVVGAAQSFTTFGIRCLWCDVIGLCGIHSYVTDWNYRKTHGGKFLSRFPALFCYYDLFLNPSQTAELVWYWQTGKWVQNDAIFLQAWKAMQMTEGIFRLRTTKQETPWLNYRFHTKTCLN